MLQINHVGTIPLETPSLLLRRLEPSDAEAVHRNWGSDPEVYRYMTSNIMPKLADVERFIYLKLRAYRSPLTYYWAIVPKAVGECVGMTTITEVTGRTANLAYTLGRKWQGMGYATEAGHAVLKLMFDTVGMRVIYGSHFSPNESSGRVLLRLGMAKTGEKLGPVPHRNEYLTYEDYHITERMWRRQQKQKTRG
jgi:ribosomal-protein-alanine N-acetyltransferase